MTDRETVTISRKKYNVLLACEKQLRALEAAGVDNWEGYRSTAEEDGEMEDEYYAC